VNGFKVEGYQVFKLTCDLFRELEVWVSRFGGKPKLLVWRSLR
jgi:hypothetical protein